jgi:RNA polymerase sigma factor (sigma-70 family)
MESAPNPARSPEDELLPTRPSLLARLRNRDDSKGWHRGWEEFYLLYHPVIYGRALKQGLSETEAEDVVQEIVIGLAASLPTFEYDPGRASFKTWVFRVVRNKVVDHLRRRGRQARIEAGGLESDGDSKVFEEMADDKVLAPDREWDLMWEANLRRAALDEVRNRVKPMTMRLYLHHVVDGNSVEATVGWFKDSQVSPDTVHLARHRVQKMLDETIKRLRQKDAGFSAKRKVASAGL